MKIALIGYGKMGHAIEEAALSRGHEIVCRIDKDNQEDFDSVSFKSADVAIEFTAPSVAVDNYRRAFAAGIPVVSGTTGWLEHLPEIREACEKGQTFFYASNFSLGVNIFFAVNKYLAGIMNHFPQYSVEIEEIHHIHKLDHPSGTAITLAEDIIGQLDAKHSWSENMPVTDDSIHITARREGEIPGTHTIVYDSAVDTIRITHEAKNRKGFALGAVIAAEFTVGKKGFLTMQDLFSLLKKHITVMNQTTTNDKYSLAERLKRVKKTRWIRFSIVALVYIGWTIWLNNYYVLFGLLLLIDIYLTQYIPWGWWKTSKNPVVRTVMEWVDAIVYALVLVYFIFIFVFQNYQIPSSSLEKSLLVGDFLLVSKMSYGPRVPNTPLHFPLAQHTIPLLNTKSYIEWPQWDYHRLKGFGPVKRNDIVVFNFPAGDTVAVKQPNPDYYTLCFLEGREAVNRNKALYGDIIYRPVDRRENYVKRCVGLPGDTFSIVNNDIYIDGVKQPRPKNMQLNYLVRTNGRYLGNNDFEKWGISVEDRVPIDVSSLNARMNLESWGLLPNPDGSMNPVYELPLTQAMIDMMKKDTSIEQIVGEPGFFGGQTYPLVRSNTWTRSDYGPVWIPKKGATLKLTLENLPIYERPIRNYEHNDLQVRDGKIYINGKETDSYTFKMDYYMMLGDNRDKSADSRYWGFVPEDHIVGKPMFVFLSLDKDKGLFDGKIRFNRMFRSVDSLVN